MTTLMHLIRTAISTHNVEFLSRLKTKEYTGKIRACGTTDNFRQITVSHFGNEVPIYSSGKILGDLADRVINARWAWPEPGCWSPAVIEECRGGLNITSHAVNKIFTISNDNRSSTTAVLHPEIWTWTDCTVDIRSTVGGVVEVVTNIDLSFVTPSLPVIYRDCRCDGCIISRRSNMALYLNIGPGILLSRVYNEILDELVWKCCETAVQLGTNYAKE